jgi:hypothetical protein
VVLPLSYACAFEVVSLFLFIYTADDLAPLFVGAMCAAGTLNVNAWGYPTLLLKLTAAILAGTWLLLNRADNRGADYPLIRRKYVFLLLMAPVLLAETGAQAAYFLGLAPDVITSCCGSLFSVAGPGVSSDLAALPSTPMKIAFYGVIAALATAVVRFVRGGAGGYAVASLSVLGFVTSIAALISFIALYVYELPTHHCPFCILLMIVETRYVRRSRPSWSSLPLARSQWRRIRTLCHTQSPSMTQMSNEPRSSAMTGGCRIMVPAPRRRRGRRASSRPGRSAPTRTPADRGWRGSTCDPLAATHP